MGFRDGGEDVRDFRAAVLGDQVRPADSLLLDCGHDVKLGRWVILPETGNWQSTRQGGRRAASSG